MERQPAAAPENWCPLRESDPRPLPYQGSALPLSQKGKKTWSATHRTNKPLERETGIEPASLAWKARVLPLNYSRLRRVPFARRHDLHTGRNPGHPCLRIPAFKRSTDPFVRWWRGLDSNQRTRKRADLQSAAINHSATSPANLGI
ncbi:hypothetical protein VARIO8X_110002 [Burkholderiales bacterium 8X]|nr:hypothetical protein VARIO8X_110002 [Burkholderiales bacterium 8X]